MMHRESNLETTNTKFDISVFEEKKLSQKLISLEEKLNKLVENQLRESTIPKFSTFDEATNSNGTYQPPWLKKDRRVNAGDMRKKRKTQEMGDSFERDLDEQDMF